MLSAKRSNLFVAGALFLFGGAHSVVATDSPATAPREAKKVFAAIKQPKPHTAKSIGNYIHGCLAGGRALAVNGPSWQAMRLSRNRVWGHPALVEFIEKLATESHTLDGWPGILVGDMSQALGGPMLSGHASHQVGLDVDIWYTQMPDRVLSKTDRETMSADNIVDQLAVTVKPGQWTEGHTKLLRRAASYPETARIFVNPAIKKTICEATAQDKDKVWLRKVRPWWKHDDHFHVRLNCPPDSEGCVNQPPTGEDDGCGKELDDWLKLVRAAALRKPDPNEKPAPPPKPQLLADMPKDCQDLVASTESGIAVRPTH